MPLESSSAAPVIKPAPRLSCQAGRMEDGFTGWDEVMICRIVLLISSTQDYGPAGFRRAVQTWCAGGARRTARAALHPGSTGPNFRWLGQEEGMKSVKARTFNVHEISSETTELVLYQKVAKKRKCFLHFDTKYQRET